VQLSENYSRMLFEKTVIGLALCRMNGNLVDVNSAFAELLGRTIEEALTLTYWQITPEKYASQEKAQVESLEKTGRYGPYEKEYIHADGHFIPVRLSGQIVEIEGKRYIWSSVEDITDHKQAEEELARLYKEMEQLSFQDGLTGIANRRMFDQTLDREWKRAQRDRSSLSLIMFDIDYFKQYNDFYGHQRGDECLKQVAKALCGVSKRAMDLFGRYGGEEFFLLLPATNETQARQLAEQCFSAVKQQKLPHELSTVGDIVTISAGVSTIIPIEETHSSILIEAADKLLYQAKQKGRNRFEHQQE
jgi:diguanylate cyclase (GGDEF)-like protein/PAS domain S-box-containing protein